MKKVIYSSVALMLFAFCNIDLKAQSEEEREVTSKVKVEVIVNEDGEIKKIVRESDGDVSVEELLDELKEYRIDGDGDEDVRVLVKKMAKCSEMNGNNFSFETEKKAYLGVKGYTMNANGEGTQSVRLMEVMKDGPAYKAGLRNEDVLVSIDGEAISTHKELVEAVRSKEPGTVVDVQVRREGKKKNFDVTLGEREFPSHDNMRFHSFYGDNDVKFFTVNVEVVELTDEDKELVSKSTGINMDDSNAMDEADLEVYPNPGNGDFSYELTLKEGGKLEVTVLDNTGKEIMKQVLVNDSGEYKGSLDLKSSPKGSYLLIFKKDHKILSEKLIKS